MRTFKPRRRPLTPERAALMERLAPAWCLDETGDTVDVAATFGRVAPLVLDIGIGLGDSLTEMALADPDTDLIGCDVHTPGIASTLARIESMGLTNVRLVHGDALVFLDRIGPGTLAGIRIYFPDPWPKARHRHRRMTSEHNVDRFARLLAPGGFLHVATDIDDYALQTERICDANDALEGGIVDRPAWRPVTRYERKGLASAHAITDLLYRVSMVGKERMMTSGSDARGHIEPTALTTPERDGSR
ncbi:MAG TPA: tRNA (guanosine(46)-N7)-methyltransferase TrmB [Ilumatobacter sp.]|nr:tRNA (guanosine(46)-N7)-methyltransferase TrmB [Ilumatobacter sp.]